MKQLLLVVMVCGLLVSSLRAAESETAPVWDAVGQTVEFSSIRSLTGFPTKTEIYEIDARVGCKDRNYVFRVRTDHADYTVVGIPLLYKTCREIEVIERVLGRYHGPQVLHGIAKSTTESVTGIGKLALRMDRGVRGLARFPGRTARDYIGTPVKWFNPNKNPDKKIRTYGGKGFLYSGEIRRTAYEFGVDAYTMNENMWRLLRKIALPRKIGRTSLTLIRPDEWAFRLLGMAGTSGEMYVNCEEAIRDNGVTELRRLNERLFREDLLHGERMREVVAFLRNVYYSPREQTYIRAYLTRMRTQDGLAELLTSLTAAATPVEAVEKTASLELLWLTSAHVSPVTAYVPLGEMPAVRNEAGELLAMPVWDLAPADTRTRSLFVRLAREAKARGLKPVVWFAHDAHAEVEKLGQSTGVEVRTHAWLHPAFGAPADNAAPNGDRKGDPTEYRRLVVQGFLKSPPWWRPLKHAEPVADQPLAARTRDAASAETNPVNTTRTQSKRKPAALAVKTNVTDGDARSVKELVAVLTGGETYTQRLRARDALVRKGGEALSAVLPLARAEDESTRLSAIYILGCIGKPETGAPAADVLSTLVELLSDADAKTRREAVLALRGLTGRSFEYGYNTPEAYRQAAIERWRGYVEASGV